MVIEIYSGGVFLGIAIIFLVIGYAMGRNSADKPFIRETEKIFNPGPIENEEDPWKDAMEGETEEEGKKRVGTVED